MHCPVLRNWLHLFQRVVISSDLWRQKTRFVLTQTLDLFKECFNKQHLQTSKTDLDCSVYSGNSYCQVKRISMIICKWCYCTLETFRNHSKLTHYQQRSKPPHQHKSCVLGASWFFITKQLLYVTVSPLIAVSGNMMEGTTLLSHVRGLGLKPGISCGFVGDVVKYGHKLQDM